jgi:hypothetical protein
LRLSVQKKKNTSIHSISEEEEEEEEEDEQFLDASDELGMEQELKDMSLNSEPISSSDYIHSPFTRTTSSSSASSTSSKSVEKPFGRRSVIVSKLVVLCTIY